MSYQSAIVQLKDKVFAGYMRRLLNNLVVFSFINICIIKYLAAGIVKE